MLATCYIEPINIFIRSVKHIIVYNHQCRSVNHSFIIYVSALPSEYDYLFYIFYLIISFYLDQTLAFQAGMFEEIHKDLLLFYITDAVLIIIHLGYRVSHVV